MMSVTNLPLKKNPSFQPFPLPEFDPGWAALGKVLPEDHLAKIVERQVNQLDRSDIDQAYRGRGSAPFDPVALLKMVLYQRLSGNHSPARWYEEARLNQATQWLGRGYTPSRRTWYNFRDRAAKFVDQLHQQIITNAVAEELLDPTVGVQDGTTIAGCASRHRTVTRSTLQKRKAQLEAAMRGECREETPRWIPPSERGQRGLHKRMEHAEEVLEERIARNAERPSEKRKDPEKIQVSLSDPVAPLGRDKQKVFRPLYTIQYMVAPLSHLILSYCCEASVTDVGTLIPMIDKTRQIVPGSLQTVMADTTYCTILDLRDCRELEVELLAPVHPGPSASVSAKAKSSDSAGQPARFSREEFQWDESENCYHCPAGERMEYFGRVRQQRHGGRYLWQFRYRCGKEICGSCPLASQCLREGTESRIMTRLEGEEFMEAQRIKMAGEEAQARYRLRNETVELAFAELKGNRRLDRLHGRGLERARAETGLMVIAQNLRRLDRLQQQTPVATKT